MKKIFMLLMVAIAAVFFTSCSKDDETEPIISGGGDNVATMTTEKKEVRLYIETAKVEVFTIDWGDGNIEKFKTIKGDDGLGVWYDIEAEHTYSQASTHTMKVTTGALTELGCEDNQLTSLDISKCTALTELYCGGNELSTNALNKIFTDLPQGKTGRTDIYIGGNPGSETCNKSIAENKGWRVINHRVINH